MSRASTVSVGLSFGLVALTALAGCPSDPSNPDVLWLTTDGDELHVKLVDSEPPPF